MTTIVHKIYHSRINLLKNLDAIGFDTEPFKHTDLLTIQQMCSSQHANMLNMTLLKKNLNQDTLEHHSQNDIHLDPVNNPNARVFVHYFVQCYSNTNKNTSFKPNNLYDLIDAYKIQHELSQIDNLTIVIPHDVNDTMLKTLGQIWENERVFVNVFSIQQLQFCILEHSYVPKHIPLSIPQKNQIYQKFYIKNDSDLPQIGRFDPAAKAVALRPGQLCQILRPNKTSITDQTFYRLCV